MTSLDVSSDEAEHRIRSHNASFENQEATERLYHILSDDSGSFD